MRPRGDSWPAPRPRNVVQRMGSAPATREVVAGCCRARAAALQTLARERMDAVRDAMCEMLVVSMVERDGCVANRRGKSAGI